MFRIPMLVALAVGLAVAGGARADDAAALKTELAALKKEVEGLKKELAALKGTSVEKPKANLAARFEAAAAVSDFDEKQKVYAVLGVEAAKAADAKLTKKAIDALSDFDTKQQVLYKAAVLLGKAGQAEDALALAKSISGYDLKQKAMAKIAKGEGDE